MMTTLLLMGTQGSAMIVAVLVLRALLLDHLPKATFCALWALVAARLLVPLFVTSPLGLWGLASHLQPRGVGGGEALGVAGTAPTGASRPDSMATAAASPFASTAPTGTDGAAPLDRLLSDARDRRLRIARRFGHQPLAGRRARTCRGFSPASPHRAERRPTAGCGR